MKPVLSVPVGVDARRLAGMHERQHLTDLNVRRLRAAAGAAHVTIAWDYPGATLLEVRILRSEVGFAKSADEGAPAQQALVYAAASGSFRDDDVRPGATYYYTVFARKLAGECAGAVEESTVAGAAEMGGRAGTAASRAPWTYWAGVEARPGAAGVAPVVTTQGRKT